MLNVTTSTNEIFKKKFHNKSYNPINKCIYMYIYNTDNIKLKIISNQNTKKLKY